MNINCPNCGCNPQNEPYHMVATHCPKCGYIFKTRFNDLTEEINMTINVNEKTYNLITKEANKYSNGNIEEYLEGLMKEVTEIIPTKEEKKQWKQYLYDSCMSLAEERPEFRPRKRDSLETLKESFFYWADEYNDGYFSEMDDADNDRYCAWLMQEYEKY